MANFMNKVSLAALKARNNNSAITVGPSPKPNIFLFACGAESGVISKDAYAKFLDPSTPDAAFQYADVVADDGTVYPMITLAGVGGPVTVTATR